MAEFEKVEADVKLFGNDVTTTIKVTGARVPNDPKGIGDYVGRRVAETLSGVTNDESVGLMKQVVTLEASLGKKESEIKLLKEQIEELKKASASKRNTPRG